MSKDKYKVINWPQYNRGLKQRGSLHIWISEELIREWRTSGQGLRGRPRVYSDSAIRLCLVLRTVYHLGLRQCEGFAESLFEKLQLSLPVPDYTTLSRRAAHLQVELCRMKGAHGDIAIDSTGLKVYGEGEWKVRKHGSSKRRIWQKLHLAVDIESQQIVAAQLSGQQVHDADMVKPLVDELARSSLKTGRLYGDGAYDKNKVHQLLEGHQIFPIIPPYKKAVKSKGTAPWQLLRNEAVEQLMKKGKVQWKIDSGYYRRNLSETAMFRYKGIIGSVLRSRKLVNQCSEAAIGCHILNQMLLLAKPVSQKHT